MKTTNRLDEEDRRLSDVLRQWRGPEPGPGFEADVWRRLAVHSEVSSGPTWPGLSWSGWLDFQPARAAAAAILVGILAGLGSAAFLSPPEADPWASLAPALNGQSLAGAYLAMASGGAR